MTLVLGGVVRGQRSTIKDTETVELSGRDANPGPSVSDLSASPSTHQHTIASQLTVQQRQQWRRGKGGRRRIVDPEKRRQILLRRQRLGLPIKEKYRHLLINDQVEETPLTPTTNPTPTFIPTTTPPPQPVHTSTSTSSSFSSSSISSSSSTTSRSIFPSFSVASKLSRDRDKAPRQSGWGLRTQNSNKTNSETRQRDSERKQQPDTVSLRDSETKQPDPVSNSQTKQQPDQVSFRDSETKRPNPVSFSNSQRKQRPNPVSSRDSQMKRPDPVSSRDPRPKQRPEPVSSRDSQTKQRPDPVSFSSRGLTARRRGLARILRRPLHQVLTPNLKPPGRTTTTTPKPRPTTTEPASISDKRLRYRPLLTGKKSRAKIKDSDSPSISSPSFEGDSNVYEEDSNVYEGNSNPYEQDSTPYEQDSTPYEADSNVYEGNSDAFGVFEDITTFGPFSTTEPNQKSLIEQLTSALKPTEQPINSGPLILSGPPVYIPKSSSPKPRPHLFRPQAPLNLEPYYSELDPPYKISNTKPRHTPVPKKVHLDPLPPTTSIYTDRNQNFDQTFDSDSIYTDRNENFDQTFDSDTIYTDRNKNPDQAFDGETIYTDRNDNSGQTFDHETIYTSNSDDERTKNRNNEQRYVDETVYTNENENYESESIYTPNPGDDRSRNRNYYGGEDRGGQIFTARGRSVNRRRNPNPSDRTLSRTVSRSPDTVFEPYEASTPQYNPVFETLDPYFESDEPLYDPKDIYTSDHAFQDDNDPQFESIQNFTPSPIYEDNTDPLFYPDGVHSEGLLDTEVIYVPGEFTQDEYEEPGVFDQYKYGYNVESKDTGNYQARYEARDGATVSGSYKVALPDGRVQIVTYIADDNGFRAEVSYEGEGPELSYDGAESEAQNPPNISPSTPIPRPQLIRTPKTRPELKNHAQNRAQNQETSPGTSKNSPTLRKTARGRVQNPPRDTHPAQIAETPPNDTPVHVRNPNPAHRARKPPIHTHAPRIPAQLLRKKLRFHEHVTTPSPNPFRLVVDSGRASTLAPPPTTPTPPTHPPVTPTNSHMRDNGFKTSATRTNFESRTVHENTRGNTRRVSDTHTHNSRKNTPTHTHERTEIPTRRRENRPRNTHERAEIPTRRRENHPVNTHERAEIPTRRRNPQTNTRRNPIRHTTPSPHATTNAHAFPRAQELATTPRSRVLATTPRPQKLVSTPRPQKLANTPRPQLATTPRPHKLASNQRPPLVTTPRPQKLVTTPHPLLATTPRPNEILVTTPSPIYHYTPTDRPHAHTTTLYTPTGENTAYIQANGRTHRVPVLLPYFSTDLTDGLTHTDPTHIHRQTHTPNHRAPQRSPLHSADHKPFRSPHSPDHSLLRSSLSDRNPSSLHSTDRTLFRSPLHSADHELFIPSTHDQPPQRSPLRSSETPRSPLHSADHEPFISSTHSNPNRHQTPQRSPLHSADHEPQTHPLHSVVSSLPPSPRTYFLNAPSLDSVEIVRGDGDRPRLSIKIPEPHQTDIYPAPAHF